MFRILFVVVKAFISISIRRILHGPTDASWSWRLEWIVATQRVGLTEMLRMEPARMRALSARLPGGMSSQLVFEQVDLGGVPAARHDVPGRDPDRFLLYIHGGGYAGGSSQTHLDITSSLTIGANARTWSLDYRLAPEDPFPAAPDDVLAAYRALLDEGVDPARLVVAGDSAGGALVLVLLIRLRDEGLPLPAAGVLISPAPDLEFPGKSWLTNRDTDYITTEHIDTWIGHYLGGRDRRHPFASPIHAELAGLPPLLVQAGGGECLYDEIVALVDKLGSASVDTTFTAYPAMPHVWHLFRTLLPEAQRAIDEISAYLRERVPS